MIDLDYIEIDKDLIPYRFDITIAGETYTFEIKYNNSKDYFTIDLYKNDEVIVLGEKIVYGKPLFTSVLYKEIPKDFIIPLDVTGRTDRITFENLNEEVLLYLVEGDEDEVLD